ncbi:MAG: hypothetical protein WED00_13855 [Aquisalimonadaceae bacterium]
MSKDEHSQRVRRRGVIATAVVLGLIAVGLYVGFILVQVTK